MAAPPRILTGTAVNADAEEDVATMAEADPKEEELHLVAKAGDGTAHEACASGAKDALGSRDSAPVGHGTGPAPGEEKPKTNRKSAIIGGVFLAAVFIGNLVYVGASHQLDEFLSALAHVAPGWLIAMAVLMLGNLLLGALAYLITAWLDPQTVMGVRDSISVEASGTFFGNLTPLSVGGLPGQIWRLCKAGYSVGEATAVQLARFSVYQVAQTLFGAILLLIFWMDISRTYGGIVWVALAIVGFKVVQTAILVLLCLFPGFVRRAGDWAIDLALGWGWSRQLFGEHRLEDWRSGIADETEKFGSAFRQLATAWRQMLIVLVVSALQVGCLYGTDWFCLMAFGVRLGFWETLCLGTLVQLVATVVPTPGGTGGIEAAFLVFFSRYLGEAAVACFLVWRVMTFYGYTLICGALTFIKSDHAKAHKPYERLQRFIGKNAIDFAGDGTPGGGRSS